MQALFGMFGSGSAEHSSEVEKRLGDRLEIAVSADDSCGALRVWRTGDSTLQGVARDDGCAVWFQGAIYGRLSGTTGHVGIVSGAAAAEHLRMRFSSRPESFLDDVLGSFAVVAYSFDTGRLCLATDPDGSRQLFVSRQAAGFSFATTAAGCALLTGSPEVERRIEDFLLLYGFAPQGMTVFRDVTAVPAGQLVFLSVDGKETRTPVGKMGRAESRGSGTADLADALYRTLRNCTADQMTAKGPVGVLLGGFDSALIASLLVELGAEVKTYSFRYADESMNQPLTDVISAHLGTEHRWVDIDADVIRQWIPVFGKRFDAPANWLNYIVQTVHVCQQMAQDGLTAVYSGDGCDALFLGYPGTYKRTKFFAALPRLPDGLATLTTRLLGHGWLDRVIGHPYRIAMNVLRAMGRDMPDRAFLSFRIFDEVSLSALRQGARPDGVLDADELRAEITMGLDDWTPARLGYLAKALVSPNKAKMAGSSDLSDLPVFSPYMHPEIRSFVRGIPDSALRPDEKARLKDPGKYILMEMARRHELLPDAVIDQPKLAAIDSPIDGWFANELRDQCIEVLAGLPFEPNRRYVESLLRPTVCERLYKRYVGSTRVISDAASLLITYAGLCSIATQRARIPRQS